MDLENKLLISITAGFLNIIVSTYTPALMKKDRTPLMKKVKNIFNIKKKLLITTSILISLLVFAILSINNKLDTMSNQYLFTTNENSSIFYSPDSYKLSSTSSSRMEGNMFIDLGDNLPVPQNNEKINKLSDMLEDTSDNTYQLLTQVMEKDKNPYTQSIFPNTNTTTTGATGATTATNTGATNTTATSATTGVATTATTTGATNTTATSATTVAATNTGATTGATTLPTTGAGADTNTSSNKYRFMK